MPWYGWVFALPLWAIMLWSFVELGLPFMLLVLGFARGRFFLRALLVFASALWAFQCLNTIVPTAVVVANASGYRPATFTVRKHVIVRDVEGGDARYTEGVIDGRHEERYDLAGHLPGDPQTEAEMAAAVPLGSRLDVLYNPDVSPGVRVLGPTADLAGRERVRLAKWLTLGLGPLAVALVIRFRWRATLLPDESRTGGRRGPPTPERQPTG